MKIRWDHFERISGLSAEEWREKVRREVPECPVLLEGKPDSLQEVERVFESSCAFCPFWQDDSPCQWAKAMLDVIQYSMAGGIALNLIPS